MLNKSITRSAPSTPFLTSRDAVFGPFFDRFLNFEPARDFAWGEDAAKGSFVPAVDIRETDSAFVVHAELAGLSKDDIQITLEDKVLRIAGERRFEKEDEKDNYRRIERAYGSFSRSFTLGGGVDPENVSAAFKDGILTITVPKKEETKPRKIVVG